MVGRYGGEEFILILKNQSLEQAIEVAERCRLAISEAETMIANHQMLKINASFGVATAIEGTSSAVVTRMADQALYMAKQQGRNQVRSFRELNLAED